MEQQDTYNRMAGRFMDSSIADSEMARSQSTAYFNRLRDKFWPQEDRMIQEAATAGGKDDQARAVRAAQADVQTALGTQRGAALRSAGRYGDVSAGATAAALGKTVVPGAAVQAAAMNNAREAAKQLGWAKRADVASLSRGLPGNSAATLGLASQMGGMGVNAAAGGMQGLSAMSGAMSNAAGTSIGGYNSAGQLGLGMFDANMRRYQSKVDFWGDIIGGTIGAGGRMAAAAMSDRRLKTDVQRVGTTPAGLPIYEYTIFGKRERGVMADEAEVMFPAAVHTHLSGYKMVDYARIG
jgi:hypothetical protein